jgi:hypothetical protein
VLGQARRQSVPDAPVRARHHGHRLLGPPDPARASGRRAVSKPKLARRASWTDEWAKRVVVRP